MALGASPPGAVWWAFGRGAAAARQVSTSPSVFTAMDNDYPLDLNEVIETVRNADVLTFRFVIVGQRLLVDGRHTEIDPPMLKLVAPVASPQERFRSLKQLRPRFRLPKQITSIFWPRRVGNLEDSGVWGALVERFAGLGFSEAVRRCEEVLQELKDLERAETQNAIRGDGYRTLWERRQ